MAKSKNRKKNNYKTSKNTKKMNNNKAKFRGDAEILKEMKARMKKMTREDMAVIEANVLTQSDDTLYQSIIKLLEEGWLNEQLEECRKAIVKGKKDDGEKNIVLDSPITDGDLWLLGMYLTLSSVREDKEQIKKWADSFRQGPHLIVNLIHLLEMNRENDGYQSAVDALHNNVDFDNKN